MAKQEKNIHTGHRSRVKAEFRQRGLEAFPEHRVLELLLFYALPQGDTNPPGPPTDRPVWLSGRGDGCLHGGAQSGQGRG